MSVLNQLLLLKVKNGVSIFIFSTIEWLTYKLLALFISDCSKCFCFSQKRFNEDFIIRILHYHPYTAMGLIKNSIAAYDIFNLRSPNFVAMLG